MSQLLEPGGVYRALQEVSEGKDPADAYAELMDDAVDFEEAVENDFHDHLGYAHDFDECRDKHASAGLCYGFTCQQIGGGIRLQVDCPCTCHQGEQDL